MSFDGLLYAIDGASGCAASLDIGEASYSAVLVDDLAGDGTLQLLAATMNGNVYVVRTGAPYHAAKTWTAQVQGLNGLVARWGYFGYVATPSGRALRDVAGQQLAVRQCCWYLHPSAAWLECSVATLRAFSHIITYHPIDL